MQFCGQCAIFIILILPFQDKLHFVLCLRNLWFRALKTFNTWTRGKGEHFCTHHFSFFAKLHLKPGILKRKKSLVILKLAAPWEAQNHHFYNEIFNVITFQHSLLLCMLFSVLRDTQDILIEQCNNINQII